MSIIHSDKDLIFSDSITYPEITIEKNQFVFISGKSGCGKSTYLKLLNRTAVPGQGTIYFQDKDINDYPVLEYRKQVLLVPQDNFLFPGSIRDNYNQYYEMIEKTPPSDEEIKRFLNICCVEFPLSQKEEDRLSHDCKNLSGGEKQRIFLSIFLSLATEVIMLDEVTSALDEQTAIKFFQNLKSYAAEKGLTVIAVSHNKKLIDQFADKCITLEKQNE